MTNEQIKQFMHESKAVEWFNSDNMDWIEYVNVFVRFADLVIQKTEKNNTSIGALLRD